MKIVLGAAGLFAFTTALNAASICVIELNDNSSQWRESCDGSSEMHYNGGLGKLSRVSNAIATKTADGYELKNCVGMGDDQMRCVFVKADPTQN